MEKVTLDPLSLKRVLALEETGVELFPPELSQEEKPLSLLGSIDFDSTDEKEAKKTKTGKESSQAWPWQSMVEHFHQARDELMTLADFIGHVEANEVLAVANVMRGPRAQQNEDLALRSASKIQEYKDVGKYLKRHARALKRQVERETVFYDALMKLQRNWKIKRQRGVSAGPGGKAGFLIDLSLPLSLDGSLIFSQRTAPMTLIKVDQDPNGLLTVHLPPGKSITTLRLHVIRPGEQVDAKKLFSRTADDQTDHNRHALPTDRMLRRIQLSMLDELIFECLCREALQHSSGISLIGMDDTYLHVGIGDSLAVVFKLVTVSEDRKEEALASSEEESLRSLIRQRFLAMLRARKGPKAGPGKEDARNLLKDLSVLLRHEFSRDKVTSALDKMVRGVPELCFVPHVVWRTDVSGWDVHFDIPRAASEGGHLNDPVMHPRKVTLQSTVVLRKEVLSVEGLPASDLEPADVTSCSCSVVELPFFLLSQIAARIVKWLQDEVTILGSKVTRNYLSLTFRLVNRGDVSLVAAPSGYSISWWMRFYSAGLEDTGSSMKESLVKDRLNESRTPTSERFLGPLSLESLRAVALDLVNLTNAYTSL